VLDVVTVSVAMLAIAFSLDYFIKTSCHNCFDNKLELW